MIDFNDNMTGKTITWNAPLLKRFKKAIKAAMHNKKDQFTFDGNEFVTAYAVYLAQYLEEKLK